jgi:hypothetical protein
LLNIIKFQFIEKRTSLYIIVLISSYNCGKRMKLLAVGLGSMYGVELNAVTTYERASGKAEV